jgi:hypothetical protein
MSTTWNDEIHSYIQNAEFIAALWGSFVFFFFLPLVAKIQNGEEPHFC